jgi:hypothetical protein
LLGVGGISEPKSSGDGKGQGLVFMTNKDAFDLWWEWAESRSIAQLRNFLGETVN